MADSDALLHVRGAEKSFGSNQVLAGVDFAVRRGEFVSLLGPSGCGKTTLLRIVAGLLDSDRGSVHLDGKDITTVPTHQRGVGVVFQSYALFPHLSVADNVAFGLKAQRLSRQKTAEIVHQFLDLVHMREMADRTVRGLSGGQQQRVAVARALAVSPKLLLLDEPFSALDRKLRETMQIELRHLLREVGITTVLVTHDQEEALVMSDRVAVMNHGRIEQFDTPDEIYLRPKSVFAMGFVGHSTRVEGRAVSAEGDSTLFDTPLGPVRAPVSYRPGASVLIAVRPERITTGVGAPGDHNTVTATLKEIVFQGSRIHLHFVAAQDLPILVETSQLAADLRVGSVSALSWPISETLVFPQETAA
jgi:putative spermidine/putrescine transport system ATP-binding protein